MAASKDVFEPKVFASNAFAPGAFRGVGASVVYQLGPFAWEAFEAFMPGLVDADGFVSGFEAAEGTPSGE